MKQYLVKKHLTHLYTGEKCWAGTIITAAEGDFLHNRTQDEINNFLIWGLMEEMEQPKPRKSSSKLENKDDE